MAVLCSNCAGKLIFNPATQRLECATCGSSFRPEDVEDKNAELHSKYYDTRVYVCSHCGAEVITSDTEASSFCVYCGNPAIVFDRISKEYKPDGLIPFQVTKEEAIKNVKARFHRNPMVPKEITVKNVPIDGSKILSDDISRKLEPFYLEDSKTFDEDYLNGFYSNTSDMTYFDLKKSAAYRCHKMFADEIVKTVKANNVKIQDSIYWVDVYDDPIYMMFPLNRKTSLSM